VDVTLGGDGGEERTGSFFLGRPRARSCHRGLGDGGRRDPFDQGGARGLLPSNHHLLSGDTDTGLRLDRGQWIPMMASCRR